MTISDEDDDDIIDDALVVVPLFGSTFHAKVQSIEVSNDEKNLAVLKGLDQITEDIRNTPDICGAFLITLDADSEATSYAMGELPTAQLYTALGMAQSQLLDIMYNDDGPNRDDGEEY